MTRAFAAVLAVVLAACTSPSTKPYAPKLHDPLPSQFGSTTTPPPAEPPTTGWWTTFHDARLDDLVVRALHRNHDLTAAVARLEAAAAQARLAGVDLHPKLDATFDAARQRQNFVGLPIPGSTGVLSRTYNSFGVDLTASWEVDLWGRIRANRSAAVADLQAAAVDLRGARQSLAAQTAKAYFAAVEARLQLDLAQRTALTYETTLRDVRTRFESGVRPSLDLRLVEANLATAQASVEQRREQLERARRQLELLLGDYPSGLVEHAADLPPTPPPTPVGLPAELLTRRPDVVAAERRLAAEDERVAAAVRAFYPAIRLTGSAGTASNELKDLVDPDFFVWSLIGGLVQPLLDGGRLDAEHQLAVARRRERAATYAHTALRAFTEVESALAAESALADRERHQRSAAESATTARELSEQRYRDGLETVTTLLDAQRRALDAQSQSLAVRRLRLDVRIDLHLALGGGFELDIAPNRLLDADPGESAAAPSLENR